MIPINNSDTAWLIVSDFNQENGRFYDELREDIINPDINHWYWEDYKGFKSGNMVGFGVGNVGSREVGMHDVNVGAGNTSFETTYQEIGGIGYGNLVGGNHYHWTK